MQRVLTTDGIYTVDFQRTLTEFAGEHPALIIRTLYEPSLYVVVPLTSYTRERWEKLRKYGCERLVSTNSIARLDKLQVLHEREIKGRWVDPVTGAVLLPTKAEIETIHDAVIRNFTLMFDKSLRRYEVVLQAHKRFENDCRTLYTTGTVGTQFCEVHGSGGAFAYPHSALSVLDLKDINGVLNSVFGAGSFSYQRGKNGARDVLSLKVMLSWQAAEKAAELDENS